MNLSLTPELERFVLSKVQSGRYNSASEVVREALRLLEQHEQARVAQLIRFQTELDRRLASLDRGEAVNGEEFFAELEREEAQLSRTRKRR